MWIVAALATALLAATIVVGRSWQRQRGALTPIGNVIPTPAVQPPPSPRVTPRPDQVTTGRWTRATGFGVVFVPLALFAFGAALCGAPTAIESRPRAREGPAVRMAVAAADAALSVRRRAGVPWRRAPAAAATDRRLRATRRRGDDRRDDSRRRVSVVPISQRYAPARVSAPRGPDCATRSITLDSSPNYRRARDAKAFTRP